MTDQELRKHLSLAWLVTDGTFMEWLYNVAHSKPICTDPTKMFKDPNDLLMDGFRWWQTSDGGSYWTDRRWRMNLMLIRAGLGRRNF